jgi:Fur family transcriptional regulator, ferric uptake regulator
VIVRTTSLAPDLREDIAVRLHGAAQRFTRNREVLLGVLAAARRPITISEIVARENSLAMSTVYRNLTVLEEIGVVHRVITTGDFTHYELAEDLTEHHHHLVCSNCGAVDDVKASPKLEQCVRDAARDIARRTGFRTERHLLDLIGRCSRCA